MRLLAALTVALTPFAVSFYAVVHWDAYGASGGVVWCIVLLAVVVCACVVGAAIERRLPT